MMLTPEQLAELLDMMRVRISLERVNDMCLLKTEMQSIIAHIDAQQARIDELEAQQLSWRMAYLNERDKCEKLEPVNLQSLCVAHELDNFQRQYEQATWQPGRMPGNELYGMRLMQIVNKARAAIDAGEAVQPVEYVTVQEAWLAAGGNPGISASKEELISALHAMDEAIDDSETAKQPASAQPVAVPAIRELTDDELWAIRNHVAINEVTRDDDSRTICIKQGRAVIRAMLSSAQKPEGV